MSGFNNQGPGFQGWGNIGNNPQGFSQDAFPALGGGQPGQQVYQGQVPQQQIYQGQQNAWGGFPQQQQYSQQYAPQQPLQGFSMQPANVTAPASNPFTFNNMAASLPQGGASAAFSTGSSSFKPGGSAAFVPKKKQQDPLPGEQAAAAKQPEKKEPEDPCYGKEKEFFIYEYDAVRNVCICTPEQLTFIGCYYIEHYYTPIDILIWLYDMAEYRQDLAEQEAAEKAALKQQQKKLKKVQTYDEEEEDSNFGMPIAKKKSAPPPKVPVFAKAAMTEAQKEEARLKKLKQMQATKAKEERAAKIVDVDKLQIQEEIVEVDETRQPASLVFIGHVDAGKSTISGNLMFAMGVVDQRTIEKYKSEAKEKNRESWWLAYVMDVNEEEKAKGKTVEMGRANFDTKKKRMTIFDAPGHKNYVPNMIMGAALADYGALVISAKKGEFEAGFEADGQTREHVQLAKSLGIYKLVIVVNKMDEPSVKWSKDRYNDIITSLRPFLTQSGYDPDKDCTFVPVSGLCGDNIIKPAPPGTCNWYTDGRTLIDIIDDLPTPPRDETAPLRVPILDKMTDKGVIAFGKVESGTVKLGDAVKIMPSGTTCQVVTVYNSKDEPVRYAKPGENVKLRLNLDSEERINKGEVICLRDSPLVPVSDLFEAEIDLLELIKYKPILSKGYQCILHIHTVADDATIKEILVAYEKNDKGEVTEKQKPQFTKSFAKIIARIQTRIPIPIEKHSDMPQLGRFTLRDEGKTIGVGKVLRYKPTKDTVLNLAKEETKSSSQSASVTVTKAPVKETFYDMETGEEISKEEHIRRKAEREKADLNVIAEEAE